jgi:hypothetical protein
MLNAQFLPHRKQSTTITSTTDKACFWIIYLIWEYKQIGLYCVKNAFLVAGLAACVKYGNYKTSQGQKTQKMKKNIIENL